MAFNRLVGRRIQQRRVRLGLSPEQYGLRIGVTGRTVRRVETGFIPVRMNQAKFASDMGLEVDELWPLSLDHRDLKRVAV
jgi:hypothetical protein